MIHSLRHALKRERKIATVDLLARARRGNAISVVGTQTVTYLSCKDVREITKFAQQCLGQQIGGLPCASTPDLLPRAQARSGFCI